MSTRQHATASQSTPKKQMSASQRKQGSVKKRPAPVNYVAPTKEAVNAFFNRSRKRRASPSGVASPLAPTASLNSPGSHVSPSNASPNNFPDPARVHRLCPLPNLKWAEREDVWNSMIKREKKHRLEPTLLSQHPEISARMRSVLIDWLIEVSEVYTLHRETLYLAVSYCDRYLSRQTQAVRKSELQLIGVSALFFAAKLEEIYPPKLGEFAYVTDSACTEVEMREMELIMLKKLQWELSPPTAISWLNLYLQAAQLPMNEEFHLPMYPKETFVQIAQLLDLCILDIGSLKFLPSVLAAACLYHFSSEDLALQCSGFTLKEISAAIRWVTPFAMTIRDQGLASLRSFRKVKPEDSHNIQTHINNIKTLETAQMRTAQIQSPKTPSCSSGLGTPVTPITPAEVDDYQSPAKKSVSPPKKRTIQVRKSPTLSNKTGLSLLGSRSSKRIKSSSPDPIATISAESNTDSKIESKRGSNEASPRATGVTGVPSSDEITLTHNQEESLDGIIWTTSPFGGPTSELVTDDLEHGTDDLQDVNSDHHSGLQDPHSGTDDLSNHPSSSRDGLIGSGSPSSALTLSERSSPGALLSEI